ncbi:hypothetical protein [Nocardia brasiliensis]|nr:hypothetical protein [Nocardia brasiliensis]
MIDAARADSSEDTDEHARLETQVSPRLFRLDFPDRGLSKQGR